ncbi:MAG: hypothetical protein ACRDLL_17680, partial [Solirubrobacterales bacterium]
RPEQNEDTGETDRRAQWAKSEEPSPLRRVANTQICDPASPSCQYLPTPTLPFRAGSVNTSDR